MCAVEVPSSASLSRISGTNEPSSIIRYGIAVSAPVLALVLTLSVPHAHKDPFFSLFMAAVAISTWIGGARPGTIAMAVSVLAGGYLVPPEGSLRGKDIHDVVQYLVFVAATVLLVFLITALQRARTRLQRSQRDLQESEARLRTVAESIPQLVWSTSAEGKIEYLNQRWCEYTGQSAAEALDAGWEAVVHPDDRVRIARRWEECLRTGEVFEMEIRLRRIDGSYRWALARAVPLHDVSGAISRWFGTCTDIQQQKQAEEMLRRSEKLEAVARLASAMAHEINNPLASVTNLLFLLRESTAQDPVSDAYVRAAQSELARVTHIANQTLGLYRDTSRPALLNVSEIIDDVLETYASHLRDRAVAVGKRYACPGKMWGHRGDLRQLVSNLLLNGIEAVDQGGTITIRLRSRQHPHRPAVGINLTVADTGHGIASEHQHRIFEPFFTTKTDKGTGLGLWVVQEIVRRYGGTVRLRSSVRPCHTGTVVSVFLVAEAANLNQTTATAAA